MLSGRAQETAVSQHTCPLLLQHVQTCARNVHGLSRHVISAPPPFFRLTTMSLDRPTSRYLCKHCSCYLEKKAYERHRSLYYDSTSHQWVKKQRMHSESEEDLDIAMFDDTEWLDDSDNLDSSDAPPIVDFMNSCFSDEDESTNLDGNF